MTALATTTPTLDPTAEARQRLKQYLNAQAMQNLPRYLVGGLAVGAAARGAAGLGGLVRRNLFGAKKPPARYISVPVANRRSEEKEAKLDLNKVTHEARGMTGRLTDFLGGGSARTPDGLPWNMPAKTTLMLGGAMAGWKGLDYMLDKQRLAKQRKDVENARRAFMDAISDMPQDKVARDISPDSEAGQLRVALDDLYQAVRTKMASTAPPLPVPAAAPAAPQGFPAGEYMGRAAGMYGTYAVLSAALAARMAYKANKRRSRREALRKAQTARQRGMAQLSPPPILAVPSV